MILLLNIKIQSIRDKKVIAEDKKNYRSLDQFMFLMILGQLHRDSPFKKRLKCYMLNYTIKSNFLKIKLF